LNEPPHRRSPRALVPRPLPPGSPVRRAPEHADRVRRRRAAARRDRRLLHHRAPRCARGSGGGAPSAGRSGRSARDPCAQPRAAAPGRSGRPAAPPAGAGHGEEPARPVREDLHFRRCRDAGSVRHDGLRERIAQPRHQRPARPQHRGEQRQQRPGHLRRKLDTRSTARRVLGLQAGQLRTVHVRLRPGVDPPDQPVHPVQLRRERGERDHVHQRPRPREQPPRLQSAARGHVVRRYLWRHARAQRLESSRDREPRGLQCRGQGAPERAQRGLVWLQRHDGTSGDDHSKWPR